MASGWKLSEEGRANRRKFWETRLEGLGETRICTICREEKHKTEFSKHAGTLQGFRPDCRSCAADRGWIRRLAQYGLTPDSYHSLAEAQDFQCAICGDVPVATKVHPDGLVVDHDHKTGSVRGLLCGGCNASLGHFNDNAEALQAALRYLERAALA